MITLLLRYVISIIKKCFFSFSLFYQSKFLFLWYYFNFVFIFFSLQENIEDCYNAKLRVQHADIADERNYYLNVQNEKGSDRYAVALSVRGEQPPRAWHPTRTTPPSVLINFRMFPHCGMFVWAVHSSMLIYINGFNIKHETTSVIWKIQPCYSALPPSSQFSSWLSFYYII